MKIRLWHKLVVLVLLASMAPLAAVSVLLIRIARDQVEGTVQQVHQLQASAAAARIGAFMQRVQERLAADLQGSLGTMPDADVQLALIWMLGKHDNLLTFRILRAHDETGAPIGDGAITLPETSIPEEQRSRFLVEPDDVEIFAERVPLEACLEGGETQVSDVYFNARRSEALVAMAVPVLDASRQVIGAVTGEVSLREVQRIVADVTFGEAGHAFVVDAGGLAVAHPLHDLVERREKLSASPIVAASLRTPRPTVLRFTSEDGEAHLGAFAPVFWGGWQLVVQQPAADAYASVEAMKQRATFILAVALLASFIAALGTVRTLTTPLAEVVEGMRRIVGGGFDHRLDVRTRDEIGDVAGAFNVMGSMLAKNQQEIRAWNLELQARVEAKTKALENAQAQLVQGAKLASLGQLGAGVAHELNNPLAGVVGQAALLRRRLRKVELPSDERARLEGYLDHVEHESARCREIIHGLLSFSQAESEGTDHVDANACILRLTLLTSAHAQAAGVTVLTDLAEDLPLVRANQQQLQQALMNILTNARQAIAGEGVITIATTASDDTARISVKDTGRGIAREHLDRVFDPFFTTKDAWQSPGLGLSVAWSAVEAHGGRIEVESAPGQGSTFTIVLPLARQSAGATPPPRAAGKGHVGLDRGRGTLAGSRA